MPVPQDKLHQILADAFPNAVIEILDMVGDNNHYSVTITDQIFAGKSRVEQHRIVNTALKDVLKEELHAMQLKTRAT